MTEKPVTHHFAYRYYNPSGLSAIYTEAQLDAYTAELRAEVERLRAELARVRELPAKWRAAPQNPDEPLLAIAADELDAALADGEAAP